MVVNQNVICMIQWLICGVGKLDVICVLIGCYYIYLIKLFISVIICVQLILSFGFKWIFGQMKYLNDIVFIILGINLNFGKV